MKNQSVQKYTIRISFDLLFDLILGSGFIFLGLVFLTISSKTITFDRIFGLLLIIMGSIPFLIFLNYLVYILKNKVQIDYEKEEFQIISSFDKKTVKFQEIDYVEIYESADIENFSLNFWYIKYYSKTKSTFIICSLITDTYFIPKDIKPNNIFKIIPLINKRNIKHHKQKSEYEELIELYSAYSTEKLMEINNSKNGYRLAAKKAAKTILQKRKKEIN